MSDKYKIPHVSNLDKELDEGKLRNVYFICGEDTHTINETLIKIENACNPYVASDFDKEKISAEKGQLLISTLDLASAFPFGSERN
jgi:DNA polymerase III delta subunit